MRPMKRIVTYSLVFLVMLAGVAMVLPAASSDVGAVSEAQKQACIGSGGQPGQGPDGEFQCIQDRASDQGVEGIVNRIINVLLSVAGVIAVLMLIIGGIRYVISGGDSNAVQGAKKTIMYAIVGLVVIFLSFAAVNFVIGELGGSSGQNQNAPPTQNSPTNNPQQSS